MQEKENKTIAMKENDFTTIARSIKERGKRKTVAVAWAADSTTREAVAQAMAAGIADAIFVGCKHEIDNDPLLRPYIEHYDVIAAPDSDTAAAAAVALVRQGKADVLMKGMLNTDNLLSAVLNKECGILAPGAVLTHVTAAEVPQYEKMLLFSDAAVIPYPNAEQRRAQVEYLRDIAHRRGVEYPRIALIHCSEKVDARHFPFTEDYVLLSELSRQGDLGHCIVDGPMDVKTACSKSAMEKKGLQSPIDGYADALVFPDIEAGNAFYKTLTLFAGATLAGMLVGATAPIVLPSRGDDVLTKFNSLIISAL